MGMWDQSGGYFVPLELQARWIAYTWGGAIPPPSESDQRLAIDAYRSRRGMSQKTQMNLAAMTFARAAGVEPQLDNWPQLRRALLFGPLAPSCFRLEGPDALPDAPARFAREAATFGAITSNELTERETQPLVAAAGRLRRRRCIAPAAPSADGAPEPDADAEDGATKADELLRAGQFVDARSVRRRRSDASAPADARNQPRLFLPRNPDVKSRAPISASR